MQGLRSLNLRAVSQRPMTATLPPSPQAGDTVELRLAAPCLSFPRWHSRDPHPCWHVVAFRCPCWILSRDDDRAGLPFPVPFPAWFCSRAGFQEPTGGGGSLDRRRGGSGCSASPATAMHGWELPPWRNIPFSNTRPCRGLSRGGGWGSSHAVSKALCCLKCSLRHLMTHSNSWKE